ncbi:MAG: ABC transporter substrate-binding protein [Cyclobacteriaceae bacterium]|nr:ABC transporter substrate-binding protein [Cyclobacteriaceae bacterium]
MNKKLLFLVVFGLIHLSISAQKRIITAGSSSTEYVCALGHCDNIVAVDRTSVFPEKMQSLPSIGYRTGINAEGILSLQPDLVIFEEEYVKTEVIDQVRSTGIRTVVVKHNDKSFEDTKARIRLIAAALNKKKEGEDLIKKIEADFASLKKKVEATKSRPTVLCVYARGTGSMQVAGGNTSFGLLPLAGTVNAISDIEGYKPLNAESLIQINPDYILFFTSGLESIGGFEGALKVTGIQQTTAGKKKQIIQMDGVLLTNWGPRVAQAAEELFYLTHPETKK